MKKIAIIWGKGIGKDFIQSKIAEKLEAKGKKIERKALGDILKLFCVDPIFEDWHLNAFFIDDIETFLKEDINVFLKDKSDSERDTIISAREFLENQEGIVASLKICKYSWTHIPVTLLTKEEKLMLVNVFKNIPSLKTRLALQLFGDYFKEKNQNVFIFSDLLNKQVEEEHLESKIDYLFNTDTRFFTELIHFLKQDYIIIYLYHKDMFDKLSSRFDNHLSELELALSEWLLEATKQNTEAKEFPLIKFVDLTPTAENKGENVLWYDRLSDEALDKVVDWLVEYIDKAPDKIPSVDKLYFMTLMNKIKFNYHTLFIDFIEYQKAFEKYNYNKTPENEKILKEKGEKYKKFNKRLIFEMFLA